MPQPRLQTFPAAAAACAGVAAWCSMGSLATLEAATAHSRVGFLPALWMLPVFVCVAVGLAGTLRLSDRVARPLFFSLILLLPWLPGPVPAAFLLWTGRPAVAVWIAI